MRTAVKTGSRGIRGGEWESELVKMKRTGDQSKKGGGM